jgi:hypothetical protein
MQKTKSQQGARRASKSAKQVVAVTNGGSVEPLAHISECSVKYAHALAQPYDSKAVGACIPDLITLPTQKLMTRANGFMSVGTVGFGFIAVNPWLMVANGNSTNASGSNAPIVYSNATYASTATPAFPFTNVWGAGVNTAASNSPYTPLQFVGAPPQVGFTYRLVGCGVRIRYTGTELNRGGRVTIYRTQSNLPVPTTFVMNANAALALNTYHTAAVLRDWHSISYFPSRQEDLSFSQFVDPTTPPNVDRRIMFIFIDGAQPGNSFEFEVISHFELQADLVMLPNKTPSHADPVGMGAVLSSVPSVVKPSSRDLVMQILAKVSGVVHEMVTQLIPAGPAIIRALGATSVQGSNRLLHVNTGGLIERPSAMPTNLLPNTVSVEEIE